MGTNNKLLMAVGAFTAVVPTVMLFLGVNMLFFVPLLVGACCVLFGFLNDKPDSQKWPSRLGIAACVFATLGPFLISAYANRSGSPIRVILPAEFTGDFTIVRDREYGTSVQLEDGVWVYRIPESGTLRVINDGPFFMWHTPTQFVDTNGQPIAAQHMGTSGGSKRSSPNTTVSSTDYDGTTHSWRVQSGR